MKEKYTYDFPFDDDLTIQVKLELDDRVLLLLKSEKKIFPHPNVICFDLSGKLLWKTEANKATEEFQGLMWHPFWKCLTETETHRHGTIDIKTGKVWQLEDYISEKQFLDVAKGDRSKPYAESLGIKMWEISVLLNHNDRHYVLGKPNRKSQEMVLNCYNSKGEIIWGLNSDLVQKIKYFFWARDVQKLCVYTYQSLTLIDPDTGVVLGERAVIE